jgi:tetratricopeptide (TPR) repeat protein
MNSRVIIVTLFLFFSLSAFAQRKNTRVKENVRGIENFVDSIPHFMFDKKELDTFFILTSRIPIEADMDGINGFVKLSFRVDSNNEINSIEVIDLNAIINQDLYRWRSDSSASSIRIFYKNEAIRMLKSTNRLWAHGVKSGKYCNSKVIMDFNFKTEAYETNQKNVEDMRRDARNGAHVNLKWACGAPVNYIKLKGNYDFGVRKMNLKEYELAILYFKEAIAYNSKDIDAYYNMGAAFMKLNKKNEACDSWKNGKENGDSEVQSLIDKFCKN